VLRLALILSLLLFSLLVASPQGVAADEPPTVDEVAAQLMCQCGCGLTVAACGGAMACSIADKMKAVIAEQIAQGRSKEEILDYFVEIYGEAVLAAPPKRGFNLSAWLIPFLAIGGGAVVVGMALWLWVRRRGVAPEEAPLPPEEGLEPYLERVERELEGWE